MSNWSKALSAWMKRNQVNGLKASVATGIAESIFSRWLSGQQLSVSPKHWNKMCAKLVKNPEDQANLLRATVLDTLRGPGANLLKVTVLKRQTLRNPVSAFELD